MIEALKLAMACEKMQLEITKLQIKYEKYCEKNGIVLDIKNDSFILVAKSFREQLHNVANSISK